MRYVIVGGVAGGAGAAARLRRLDEKCEIVMLEKNSYISFANCGLPYYLGGVIEDKTHLLVQTPESFTARFNVDVRTLSEVISVDVKNKTVKIKNLSDKSVYDLSYDQLILSPGAIPIVPKIPINEKMPVFTLRNLDDTYKIKDHLIMENPKSARVIGGGFIGVEVAENLKKFGLDVTIIEGTDHLFTNLDLDMAHSVHTYVRSKGVKLALSHMANEITDKGVVLQDGGFVAADMVVLSVGVRPATDFLSGSGVNLGRRGEILTDDYLHTNVDSIWAVGDAIGVKHFVSGEHTVIPLACPANKQARLVADNIKGRNTKYRGSLGTAIAKVFEMAVASTGLSEKDCIRLGIDYYKSFSASASHASYYPGSTPMMIKLIYDKKGKVLGGQIVGYDGVDKRIDTLVVAIQANMTVFDLHELDLAYAPPFSSAKDPINMAGYIGENVVLGESKIATFDQVAQMGDEVIKLDVRTKGECAHGMVPGFINIPLDSLRERYTELDKNKKVYIHCHSGLRAYLAERILTHMGYDCYNIFGSWMWYESRQLDKAQTAKENREIKK
jgi:NADPH-dependent 2,4-dienoyl-CoA reductase/sulfur reductase-like enzyme/rhodanese-related sulfurtransferase